MTRFRSIASGSWLLVVGLLVLLVVLALLQHHWVDEMVEADRERRLSRMRASATRFAADFDRELSRILVDVGPEPRGMPLEQRLAGLRLRWETTSPFPDVVREVFLVPGDDEQRGPMRLDTEAGRFESTPWPAELEPLLDRLGEAPPHTGPYAGHPVAEPAIPALLLPVPGSFRRGPRGWGASRERRHAQRGTIVVWLDLDVIVSEILPELADRHFGGVGGLDVHVDVERGEGELVYEAGPPLETERPHAGDVIESFFGRYPFPGARRSGRRGGAPPGPIPPVAASGDAPADEAAWRLVVTHPAGSLDAAVASRRTHDLVVSSGILILLGATMAFLLISARRAQRLAHQQLEFVAGVSHELKTPLAAMRSAAENLADGIVDDTDRVKQYGTLIAREGRRLSDMVGQVLSFAGMQARTGGPSFAPAELSDIVATAVEDCRPLVEETGARIETELADGLPRIRADAESLGRAVRNLLDNAVKYGGDEPVVRVRAARASGDEVTLSVEDRGAGIHPEDRRRVFEPFFRGRRGKRGVPGSGLGLTLVKGIAEAHGGRVSVETSAAGTRITLHLPAGGGSGEAAS